MCEYVDNIIVVLPPPMSFTVKPFDQRVSEADQFADKLSSPKDSATATGADRDGSGDSEVAVEKETEKATSDSEPPQEQAMETDQLEENLAQETKRSRLETAL